jgi:hypothetical protein
MLNQFIVYTILASIKERTAALERLIIDSNYPQEEGKVEECILLSSDEMFRDLNRWFTG